MLEGVTVVVETSNKGDNICQTGLESHYCLMFYMKELFFSSIRGEI